MQLSFFLKKFDCDENKDHVILFSTKKASIIRISKEKYQQIKKGEISDEEESLLRELELIVDDVKEEKESIKNYIDETNDISKELDLTIVTTLDCNFNCSYCFEGTLKDNKPYLSEETQANFEHYIKKNLTPEMEGVYITFYGGEPLLNYKFIKSFSEKVKTHTENLGKKFRSSMITNGSLFTRKIAKELCDLGLVQIQTTLDGTKTTHNSTRPFTSGKGSFDIILKNMKETCDLVKINTGGNYEKHNYKDHLKLIPFLVNEGLGPDKINELRFSPVMKTSQGSYKGGYSQLNEDWIIEADLIFREELLKHGFAVKKPAPFACAVERPHIFTINYNGDFYKCPLLMGKDEFIAGNIKNGPFDYDKTYNVGFWKNNKCLNCEYLPLCFGGCRYYSYLQNGNTSSIDCQKDYLDAILEKYIKMDLKYGNV